MVFILWSYGKDAASLLPLASGMYSTAKIIVPYLTEPFITNINMESEKVRYYNYLLDVYFILICLSLCIFFRNKMKSLHECERPQNNLKSFAA